MAVCKDLETSLLQGRSKRRSRCRGSSGETRTKISLLLLFVFCYVVLRMIENLFEKVKDRQDLIAHRSEANALLRVRAASIMR